MKRVLKTFLDENSPFTLDYGFDVVNKDGVFTQDPKYCLCTMSTVISTSNSYNKQFVCKNETFDQQGRLILFYSDRIFCELEKLTAELVEKYQPSVPAFQDGKRSFLIQFNTFLVTWVTQYRNPGGYARMQSGWSIFDEYEEAGIPLCSFSPERHLVQQEELSISKYRNAHSLCIYPE